MISMIVAPLDSAASVIGTSTTYDVPFSSRVLLSNSRNACHRFQFLPSSVVKGNSSYCHRDMKPLRFFIRTLLNALPRKSVRDKKNSYSTPSMNTRMVPPRRRMIDTAYFSPVPKNPMGLVLLGFALIPNVLNAANGSTVFVSKR